MKDLEARKRLLVAECEVFRQTLRLDVQNLRLYTAHMRRRAATYAALKPVLLMVAPLVSSWFTGSGKTAQRKPKSLFSMVMSGWRVYKTFRPLLLSLMAQYGFAVPGRSGQESDSREDEVPAATI